MKIKSILISIVLFLKIGTFSLVNGAEINVAVASNFTNAIKKIAQSFEKQTSHRVNLAFGSTGKHYAQIKNGAPFDLFLAADVRRPKLLEDENIAIAGSRYTYALGNVVLWSPNPGFIDSKGDVLFKKNIRHVAIANPRFAPYGVAAKEILQQKKLWDTYSVKVVRGENISQTFQFVLSGNVELGFVAYSQIIKNNHIIPGSFWNVPQKLYTPIAQQVVILKESALARQFWHYLKSDTALKIITAFGYGIPE